MHKKTVSKIWLSFCALKILNRSGIYRFRIIWENTYTSTKAMCEHYQRVNINVRCNTCGENWSVKTYNLFAGCGCPHCKESSYEKRVRELLVKKDVDF